MFNKILNLQDYIFVFVFVMVECRSYVVYCDLVIKYN